MADSFVEDSFEEDAAAPPEAPPAAPEEEPKLPDPGLLRTIVSQGLQGFTKGGSDEAVGGITQLTGQVKPGMGWKRADGSMDLIKTDQDAYRAGRDTERDVLKGASQHHPVASFLSQVGGDIASDAVAAGLGVPGVGSGPYNALTGALTGFLSNDADLTSEKRTPENVASAMLSTGVGGAAGYAVPKVGGWAAKKVASGARNAAEGLKNFAEERAVKVLGRDLGGLLHEGVGRAREVGRDMLDSGVLRGFFGTTTEQAGERVGALEKQRGEALGEVIKQLDAKMSPDQKLNVDRFADYLEKKLGHPEAPADKGVGEFLQGEIGAIRERLNPKMPMSQATLTREPAATANLGLEQVEKLLKRPYQARARYDKTQGPNQEGIKRLASEIRAKGEEMANDVVSKNAPELAGAFKSAKDKFGLASEAADIAEKQLGRDLKNRFLSPTDYGAGMAAASNTAAKGPEAALESTLTALAHKFLRERGSSVAAKGADKAADLTKRFTVATDLLGKYGPEAGAYMTRYLLREYPGAAEEFLRSQAEAP